MNDLWYAVYAVNAREATGHEAAPCTVCGDKFRRGERIADLSDGTGQCHVAGCAAWHARQGEVA